MEGFFCKLLVVDATRREYTIEPIDENLLKKTLGGKGLAVKLLLDRNPSGVAPFDPENHLIIATGPLSASSVYGSSRYGVFSKSPLTRYYGESYSGGNVAYPISGTGFDAIILKGASKDPLWLEITPDSVLFHDASEIWGKDTFETETYIKGKSGGQKPGVMVIGPAGENLVRFAVIKNNRWRVAGRTGMGAVLGSKKIKGISFQGDRNRPLKDRPAIKQYNAAMLKKMNHTKGVLAYRNMGTPMMVDLLNNAGAFPTEYWRRGRFEAKDSINAAAIAEKLGPKPHACKDCFMACGKLTNVGSGRHKGLKIEGPEYETIYSFGGLCMICEIEEIAYLNDLCDRLGVDTISSGNLCAFAMEASRSGKIDEHISYGSADDVKQLICKIVKRKGFGGILAEGIKPAAEELDMQDRVVHVKGMEPAGYDPRVLKGMGLAYAVSERGACHLRSTFYKPELAGMIDPDTIEGKAELFRDFEDRCTLFDSLILCRFFRDIYGWEALSDVILLSTGLWYDKTELENIAADIKDNTRRFNIREGLIPEEDTLPEHLLKNSIDKETGITETELKRLISDYYRVRGWSADGIPPEKEN